MAGASGDTPRADRIVAATCAAILLVLFAVHIRGYFFLLDDFVVLGEAASRGVTGLLAGPLFNFYRPAGPLWLLAQFQVFGWAHPSGYAALAIIAHAASAAAVGVLARRVTGERHVATIAAALFLISPWATEPFLWVSGVFDLLATLGLVAALALALAAIDAGSGQRAVMLCAAATGCAAIAMLAKEIGVLAPAILVATLLLARERRAWTGAPAIACVATFSVTALLYLLWRERLLPGLGGGYGDLGALLGRGSIGDSVMSYARALVEFPLPGDRLVGWLTWPRLAAIVVASVACMAVWMTLRTRPRIATLCGVGIAMAVAPVLWVSLIEGNSAGNRFLYFAGVWFAILMAAGMSRLPLVPRLTAFGLFAVIGVTSVAHQVRLWGVASSLSRETVEQMRGYRGGSAPLFVENLPSIFAEGPYVINPLAFSYYDGGGWPRVRAHAMTVRIDRGAPLFAVWIDQNAPEPDETRVRLRLPVWSGESRVLGAIDAPAAGQAVTQPFTIRGWAIDADGREGAGIESVRVYAYPVPGDEASALFVGVASFGSARSDVAAVHGPRFAASGFSIEASNLKPGLYEIVAFARPAATRVSAAIRAANVVVR